MLHQINLPTCVGVLIGVVLGLTIAMITSVDLQTGATVVLVVVTAIYVFLTHEISQASETSARASRDMADRMPDSIRHMVEPMLPSTFKGYMAHRRFARRLPTLRWHLLWGPYVVVGEPDGIGPDYVYEFKEAGNEFFARYEKPVALAQADLYGLMFNRPRKVVEIRIRKTGEVWSFDEAVDELNAVDTLEGFRRTDASGQWRPPRPFKCKSCDFRTACPWQPTQSS